MSAKPRPIALIGKLEGIGPDGVARGWCWSPQDQRGHRTIRLVSGTTILATASCNIARPDLSQLGMGEGRCGFEAPLARVLLGPAPGRTAVALVDEQTGRTVGTPVVFTYSASAAPPDNVVHAHLDRADDEGMLSGWAWCPARPERRIKLRFLVDGEPVGSTVANMFRGDLQAAGAGDGQYAFSFLLPWKVIARTSACRITLLDDATGEQLNSSTVFRRPALRPVEDRLLDAERNLRLLAARMTQMERRREREKVSSRAILSVIGAFFARLAEMSPEEVPTALVPSLSGLLEQASARLRPFALRTPVRPAALLCFYAAGSLDGVHTALSAVHAVEADAAGAVAILDDGQLTEAILMPSLVRNLRYVRLPPGQSSVTGRNLLARSMESRVLVFCSPAARLRAGWLAEVLVAFERDPDLAVLGGRLVRDDGTLQGIGLLLDGQGTLADPAASEDAQDPRFAYAQPLMAVSDCAMAIRTAHFEAIGGFDESFADPAVAAIEFCLRCWQAGRSVRTLPAPAIDWSPEGDGRPELDADLLAMLAGRWLEDPPPAWPSYVGQALLVAAQGQTSQLAPVASALQRNGWRVSATAPGWEAEDTQADGLRAEGVMVLRPPFQLSVAATLADPAFAYGLVHIAGAVVGIMSPERARELAPQAKIVLALGETDLPPDADLIAAAAHSDLVLLGAPGLASSLASIGKPLVSLTAPGQADGDPRASLFLLEQGVDQTDVDWFVRSVWPAIRLALPKLKLVLPDGRPRRAGRNAIAASANGLPEAWLAVLPQRSGQADAETLKRCRQAGTPLVVMRPVAPVDDGTSGVILVDDDPAAVAQLVAALAQDPAAWSAALPAPSAEISFGGLAARYAEALGALGLPSATRPPGN